MRRHLAAESNFTSSSIKVKDTLKPLVVCQNFVKLSINDIILGQERSKCGKLWEIAQKLVNSEAY